MGDQTHLKGTISVSTEGINLSLAGSGADVAFVIDKLQSAYGFTRLILNSTYSDTIPFKRLLVKVCDTLVATSSTLQKVAQADRTTATTVTKYSAPAYLSSETLKQWLDDDRDFTLLDLRNGFEYKLGSFTDARHLGLRHFRELRKVVNQLTRIPKDKPLVTFCTGGIRCEKGAPVMATLGFAQVYQLRGGILDYLSKFGGHHWHGDCFVFDERVSLDSGLNPTYAKLCRSCQAPLPKNAERFCSACVNPA